MEQRVPDVWTLSEIITFCSDKQKNNQCVPSYRECARNGENVSSNSRDYFIDYRLVCCFRAYGTR